MTDTQAVFEEAFSRVFGTIRIAPDGEEGIQPDMFYHPSQMQPPGSNEGLAFATECARFVALAHGTPWQASAEVMNLLATFLLNGQQWFMRNGVIDSHLGTRGSDPGPRDREELAAVVEQLTAFGDTPRRAELNSFAQRLAGRGNTLTGHRHFWRSGFSVHQRPAFYASVQLSPAHVAANGKPLLWHSPQADSPEGMICVMRSGHEYDGIRGLATDAAPPGTTFKEARAASTGWALTGGVTRLSGGISEGDYGAAAIQSDRAGVSAAKSWFYFDQSFVCLGAGIRAENADGTVFTSVNDCQLNGAVAAEVSTGLPSVLEPGRLHELPNVTRVSHDGITYHFLRSAKLVARIGDTGKNETGEKPDTPDRFTLWLDHGMHPQEDTYAYMVLPLGGDVDAKSKIDDEVSQVEVLANTPLLQAVRHRGLRFLGIVFWQAGLVALPDGGRVAANQPCILLCRDTPSSGKRLSIANLRKEATTVHVEYAGRSHAFELPGGLDAGRGINRSL